MLFKKAPVLVSACFWLIIPGLLAQEQKVADSLDNIYHLHTDTGRARFELLKELSFNELTDLNKAVKYADELISLSKQTKNDNYLRTGYFIKGTKQRLLGNLDEALDAFFKSAEIARRTNNIKAEGETYGAIADTYSVAGNFANAFQYYFKAIASLRHSKADSTSLASVLSNAGDAYLKSGQFDSALVYFYEAKSIFEKVNYQSGIGYSLGNIGMVYANVGRNQLAEKNINEAIRLLEGAQDYYPICVYLISMANVYLNKGDNATALNYTKRSLQLAEQHHLKEQIADASSKLSEIYERQGDIRNAFQYYKKHIVYRDSINNVEIGRRMAEERADYEISQKQKDVDNANMEKRNLVLYFSIIIILSLLLLLTLYWLNKSRAKEKIRLHEQELLNARLEIQEHTYRNISQELHDNIGQALSLAKLNMNVIDLDKREPALEKLAASRDLLSKAIQDIRDVSKTLNTDFINQIGLVKAIEQQLQLLKRTRLYTTHLCIKGEPFDFEGQRELLVFRIVQELLNNILKHAEANEIGVCLQYDCEKLLVEVWDNGKGFDPACPHPSQRNGLGLRNIQNRLKLIKGTISFESKPGKGTNALVQIVR